MKSRNILSSVLIALPLILGASFAQAQSAEELLATLDADGNGSISKEEAAVHEELMSKWDDIDADANGEISVEELAAAMTE